MARRSIARSLRVVDRKAPSGHLAAMHKLLLVRANKSRGGGHWSDDDYDVYDGDRVVGRIMLHPQAPEGQPWFWTITARRRTPSISDRGYAASREQAMADFKARWLSQ